MRLGFLAAVVLFSLSAPALGAGGPAWKERLQKTGFLLNLAVSEYALAVEKGRVINPQEYQETKDILAQARTELAQTLQETGMANFDFSEWQLLEKEVARRADPGRIAAVVEKIKKELTSQFGVSLVVLPAKTPSLLEGKKLYDMRCAICHGASGDGRGPAAAGMNPKPADFTEARFSQQASPFELWQVTTVGIEGTAMISWASELTEQQRWDVVSYIWALTAGGQEKKGQAYFSSRKINLPPFFLEAAYWAQNSDDQAAGILREQDPSLAQEDALALARYLRLKHHGSSEEALWASASAGPVSEEADLPSWALFVQSLTIILREGMEAILILVAIVAYLKRIRQSQHVRPVWWGAGAAVVASVVTAWIFEHIFKISPLQQEALEGITMLAAVVVLFYISNWILAKIDVRRWQAFIQGHVREAMSAGSLTALALTAFLAVYREGFETVLFYKALTGYAKGGGGWVLWSGFMAGCAALVAVFALLMRFGVRIPLRKFFIITSALLFVLAFSFMGQGLAELQEAGWIPSSRVPWLPAFPLLGIYPTVETLAGQLLILAALALSCLYALIWQPARERKRLLQETHSLESSIQALHDLSEDIARRLAAYQKSLGQADAAHLQVVSEELAELDRRSHALRRQVQHIESQLLDYFEVLGARTWQALRPKK